MNSTTCSGELSPNNVTASEEDTMPQIDPRTGTQYSQAELEEAFKLVQDPKHWKGPVKGIVPNDKVDVVRAAVNHFAYGNVTVTPYGKDRSRITAPGYWAFEAGQGMY
jgi:hypothetical protein